MSTALVVGAGAIAGCKASAADGPAIRISKTAAASVGPAQAPSPAVSKATPPGTRHPVRPSKPPAPAAPATSPGTKVLMSMGSKGGQVRELQARLRQLGLFGRNPTGYYGSVTTASAKSFQRRHGLPVTGTVADRTWQALGLRTHEPTRTELYPPTSLPLAAPDPRCMVGRALCISKKSRTLAWMVDGKVRAAMDVRFGSAYTPTREGEFKVDFKSRHHESTIYHTPMPYALFFSRGQAVHYSADFAASGYAGASHGCVNVRDKKKIAALFAQVRIGDKVVVYK